ncbi:unnamed protein product, partial [Ranitomeya imitator]
MRLRPHTLPHEASSSRITTRGCVPTHYHTKLRPYTLPHEALSPHITTRGCVPTHYHTRFRPHTLPHETLPPTLPQAQHFLLLRSRQFIHAGKAASVTGGNIDVVTASHHSLFTSGSPPGQSHLGTIQDENCLSPKHGLWCETDQWTGDEGFSGTRCYSQTERDAGIDVPAEQTPPRLEKNGRLQRRRIEIPPVQQRKLDS